MIKITKLKPNIDFTYKHLNKTPDGFIVAQPFIEVISGVYTGLKIFITMFCHSALHLNDNIKDGKLVYDYKLIKYCKNNTYPVNSKITLDIEDQEFLHSLVYSYIIDINKRELFKNCAKPISFYNS